jgi:hypothetical protein
MSATESAQGKHQLKHQHDDKDNAESLKLKKKAR